MLAASAIAGELWQTLGSAVTFFLGVGLRAATLAVLLAPTVPRPGAPPWSLIEGAALRA